MSSKFVDLMSKFGIDVDNYAIYKEAFTHGSSTKGSKINYQKLEFLGDAILQFIVSDKIYKNFKQMNQGELTLLRSRLVCTESLNELTNKMGLKDFLVSNSRVKINDDILNSKNVGADIFESLVAAIYLDKGLNVAKEFIYKTVLKSIDSINPKLELKDSKTLLQEHMQSFSKQNITYNTYSIDNKLFKADAIHDGIIYGSGTGNSKFEAEENAATIALKKLIK
ncbi:ribonuclease III [Mycoplasma tauri]|uniref:ribonuclease III n=1 Tax=Mycoplasma tauri TaxID=547987 RepID=UPI0019682908|nr:ribonuclease III [Mycoplasma tauri]QSB07772.1 ribonuclease III [Mycoplasma tauri]